MISSGGIRSLQWTFALLDAGSANTRAHLSEQKKKKNIIIFLYFAPPPCTLFPQYAGTPARRSGSKQTNQSMNPMIAQVIHWFLHALPMRKIWHFSGKFDQHLTLFCGTANLNQNYRQDRDISFCESLVRLWFSRFTDNFGIGLQKSSWKQLQF